MSGKWTRIYEGDAWRDVYIEDWPATLRVGTAGTLPPEKAKVILGPDGKPARDVPPARRVGFDPERAR